MMRTILILAMGFVSVSSALGQDIVEVKRTEPQTRVYVRTKDNVVIVTNLKDMFQTANMLAPQGLQVLNHPGFLEKLELIPEQRKTLDKINRQLKSRSQAIQKKYQKLIQEAGDKRKVELAGEYLKKLTELREEAIQEIREHVTLPHQNELVARYNFQRMAKRKGFYKAILNEPVMKWLEVKNKQKQKITEIVKDTDQEIAKQIKRLRAEAEQKIKKILDTEQNEKLKSLSDSNENK